MPGCDPPCSPWRSHHRQAVAHLAVSGHPTLPHLAVRVAADDDVLDAVDDAAELERRRLSRHRLRVVQLGVRHQVTGVAHCGPASQPYVTPRHRGRTSTTTQYVLEAGIAKHCLGSKIVVMHVCDFNNEICFTTKVPL